MSNNHPVVKLIMVGDSGVGKSSLLVRFVDGKFDTTFITTIGIDFKEKVTEVDGKPVLLSIWDAAGQERFRSITSAYYRGCKGVIFVYDVTDRQSFEHIHNWMRNFDCFASEVSIVRCIVGNKADLESKRTVNTDELKTLAESYPNTLWLETSAKTDLGVQQLFTDVTRNILTQKSKKTSSNPPIILNPPNPTQHSCCK